MVRRYLNFTAAEWDALTWDLRRAYLDGLENDENVPFGFADDSGPDELPEGQRPTVREGVDPGANVIDLAAMRASLESGRQGV